jgi:hypothetical protein
LPASGAKFKRIAGTWDRRRADVVKDLIRLLRGQPFAGVADRDRKLLVIRSPRLDGKLARSIHILHRIYAVINEVHQDLLQLRAISHDLGKICRQLCPN